jgi:amino acid permease
VTASAHIVTAVIGSGVLSLAWAVAQLGWIVGTIVLLLFSLITLITSFMLANCYRYPDPIHGVRNPTYMTMVKNVLGR